jgi:hypothetical protein
MAFTDEDKHAIEFLRKNKNYGVKRLLKEFPDKGWTRGGLNTLLAKIDRTGSSLVSLVAVVLEQLELWPPNSPDLNPVDYKIWGFMQDKVYSVKIRDVNHLRQRIKGAWNEMDQRIKRRISEAVACTS